MVFDIDFPRLQCEYCRIQATNFMGTHNAGLATRVNKYHLDKAGAVLGKHVSLKSPLVHEVIDDAETANSTAHTTPLLDLNTYEGARAETPLLFLSLCVERNSWCAMLAPVWERAAQALRVEHAGAGGDDGARGFAFARVDCGDAAGRPICAEFEVRRRRGSDGGGGSGGGAIGAAARLARRRGRGAAPAG
jgi:hypothetical protein